MNSVIDCIVMQLFQEWAIHGARERSVAAGPWQVGDAPAPYDAARESIASAGPWLPGLDTRYRREDAEHWVRDRQRVAEKIGATFEGARRDRLLERGKASAARLYSLTRADLEGALR